MDLLTRLLAGERGQVPLYLAMLLERSSLSDHGDEHYRQILPAELADLKLSPDTTKEIIEASCSEVSRNPDQASIFAISCTGTDQAIKVAVQVLTNPPRPLTMAEYRELLAVLNCYLTYRLAQGSEFVQKADLERLVQLAQELQDIEEIGAGADSSARIGTRMHAAQLLKSLTQLGIRDR